MPYVHEVEDEQSRVLAGLLTNHDAYLLPDGTETRVATDAAWCRQCRRFVNVERLRSAEQIEAVAREFYRLRKGDPLVPPDTMPAEQSEAINEQMQRRELQHAEQWRVALKSRESPARCLECGMTDYATLPERGIWIENPSGAGGRVRLRPNSIHLSGVSTGRLYDIEGRRLPDRYASW